MPGPFTIHTSGLVSQTNSDSVGSQDSSFECEWKEARSVVSTYCRRAMLGGGDSEDVVQEVAVRAWRGYSSFRRDASFLSWVLAIARREVARAMERNSKARKSKALLDHLDEELPQDICSYAPPQEVGGDETWIGEAAKEAFESGHLSDTELVVLMERLTDAEANWNAIGGKLHMSGSTVAVTHCRAVPKLRVFLFTHHMDRLGGYLLVNEAFHAAQYDKGDPLDEDEVEVFQRVVLRGENKYRKAGWRTDLRAACAKVIKYLEVP